MGKYYGKVVYYPDGTGYTVVFKKAIDTWGSGNGKKTRSEPIDDDTVDDSMDNIYRSVRRSKQAVRDYIKCNDFTHFVTLTFKPEFNTDDLRFTKLQNWLKYMKKKHGNFEYVLIPERHKNNSIHFHGVMNLPGFDLVEAQNKRGAISFKGQQVYNLKEWSKTGYSTATVIKDKSKIAGYVTKYVTKDFHDTVKKHKKKYWCSNGLRKPVQVQLKVIPKLDGKPDFENDFVTIYNFN